MTNHVIPELDFELLPQDQQTLPAAELFRFLEELINLCDILVGSFMLKVKRCGMLLYTDYRGYYVVSVLPKISKSGCLVEA